ncbi:MAG: hypothetical protein NVS3B2_04560 [Ramlibacter sp.]
MKSTIDVETLDPVRRLLVDRMDAMRMTWKDLSLAIGREASYMHSFIRRAKQEGLPEDVRDAVATALGLEPDQLRGRLPFVPRVATPPRVAPSDLIPLFLDTGTLAPNHAVDMVARPPGLPATAHGFAVWVTRDDGKRLRAGDVLMCDPRHPARPGDLVVIERNSKVEAIGELRAHESNGFGWRVDAGGSVLEISAADGAHLAKVVATRHA